MKDPIGYAMVKAGVVVNISLWDGETEYTPPEGVMMVPLTGDAGIGWTWDGTNFVPPAP